MTRVYVDSLEIEDSCRSHAICDFDIVQTILWNIVRINTQIPVSLRNSGRSKVLCLQNDAMRSHVARDVRIPELISDLHQGSRSGQNLANKIYTNRGLTK